MKAKEAVSKMRIIENRQISLSCLICESYSDRYRIKNGNIVDWNDRVIKIDDPHNINTEY